MKPMIPLHAAGDLMLPPMSVPIANVTHLEDTKAPSPPELPPQVRFLSYGLRALPNIRFSVCPTQTNCGKFPLTIGIAP